MSEPKPDRAAVEAARELLAEVHFQTQREGACGVLNKANAEFLDRRAAELAPLITRHYAPLVEAAEHYSRSENHSPCRSGGFDETGICPNARAFVGVGKAIRAALDAVRGKP